MNTETLRPKPDQKDGLTPAQRSTMVAHFRNVLAATHDRLPQARSHAAEHERMHERGYEVEALNDINAEGIEVEGWDNAE